MGYNVEWQDGKKRRVDELKLKYDDSAIDPSLDFKKRLATLLYTRRIIGVETKAEEVIVGTALSEQTITDEGGDEMDDTNVSFSFVVYSFLEQNTNFHFAILGLKERVLASQSYCQGPLGHSTLS